MRQVTLICDRCKKITDKLHKIVMHMFGPYTCNMSDDSLKETLTQQFQADNIESIGADGFIIKEICPTCQKYIEAQIEKIFHVTKTVE